MRTRGLAIVLIVVAAAAAIGVLLTQLGGFSARTQPTVIERVIARTVRRLAVPRADREARNPVAFSPDVWAEARAHFADHCAVCHANNGSGDTPIGMNLYPKAPDMRLPDTQRLSDGEIYWIIENGVRLTGMPAWGTGGRDDLDTWKIVHFIRRLADLSPEAIQEMEALNPKTRAEFEEEQQDREFLLGNDPDTARPAPSSHHHKE